MATAPWRVASGVMTEFRNEITTALGPIARRLDLIDGRLAEYGQLIARLDERSKQRWNGHAKPAVSGAALMGVIWALVEVIKIMAAAP